jgi:hypothetical protein
MAMPRIRCSTAPPMAVASGAPFLGRCASILLVSLIDPFGVIVRLPGLTTASAPYAAGERGSSFGHLYLSGRQHCRMFRHRLDGRTRGRPLVAVERGDLAVDKVPVDLAGELCLRLMIWSSHARNRSPDLVVSGFFGRIVLLRCANRIMLCQKAESQK